jgi:hypothetical protein
MGSVSACIHRCGEICDHPDRARTFDTRLGKLSGIQMLNAAVKLSKRKSEHICFQLPIFNDLEIANRNRESGPCRSPVAFSSFTRKIPNSRNDFTTRA